MNPKAIPGKIRAFVAVGAVAAVLAACGDSADPAQQANTEPPAATQTTATAGSVTGSSVAKSDPASGSDSPAGGDPVVIENCGLEQTFTTPPQRVVIMNGASVGEVTSLIMLGLEDKIVANAQSYGVSDDPEMAAKIAALPTGDIELNDRQDIAAEQMIALKPDLVISTWAGGFDAQYGFATR